MAGRRRYHVMSTLTLLLAVPPLLACGDEDLEPIVFTQQQGLPRLVEVPIPALDSLAAGLSFSSTFAVSPRGRVAFLSESDPREGLIAVVDTNGTVLYRVAPQGTRRGELQDGRFALMGFAGDTLVVVSHRATVLRFGHSGKLIDVSDTLRDIVDGAVPLRFTSDSIDFAVFDISPESGMHISRIARLATNGSGGRTLIDADDQRYYSLRAASPWALNMNFGSASSEDEVIVADRINYRFQSYGVDGTPRTQWGREVPQRFRSDAEVEAIMNPPGGRGPVFVGGKPDSSARAGQEAYLREAQPQFVFVNFDDHGRLWTFGYDSSGASVADVFADTILLGSVSIGCRHQGWSPSMKGDFLLVLCQSDVADEAPRLRLFRMVSDGR